MKLTIQSKDAQEKLDRDKDGVITKASVSTRNKRFPLVLTSWDMNLAWDRLYREEEDERISL